MFSSGRSAETPLTCDDARRYLEKRLGHSTGELQRFPRYIDIDTVNQCNARCIMCGVDFRGREKKRMPEALFDKILDELAGHADQIERVGLAVNCEPLLDPKLEDKIRRLKEIGIRRTYIATNASLLPPEKAERLLAAGLDVTCISIDSLNKDVFETIRSGLRFDKVYRNAIEFIRLKQDMNPDGVVRIEMVLQDLNRDEAEAFERHWASILGPNDMVVVTRAYDWGRVADAGLRMDGEAINLVPCVSLWSSLVVDVDGIVPLCCKDVDNNIVLGDLGQQSIEEIWHGEALAKVRRAHMEKRRDRLRLCDGCAVWSEEKHVIKKTIA